MCSLKKTHLNLQRPIRQILKVHVDQIKVARIPGRTHSLQAHGYPVPGLAHIHEVESVVVRRVEAVRLAEGSVFRCGGVPAATWMREMRF